MERIKAVNPNMYTGFGYLDARSELRRLTKLASETGQEVVVIPHLIALKDVMDSMHPGIKDKRPVPPEYVSPPPLEIRWGDQHDRVLKRPVPPDVPTPPIKMIGGSELVGSKTSCSWLLWFFGICIGIAIGIQLAKVI